MNEKNIYIVRCGEVALKGMNKPYFERVLLERVRGVLTSYENTESKWNDGLMIVKVPKEIDREDVIRRVSKVFGVASVSPAVEAEKDIEQIGEAAAEFMMELIEKEGIKTFKVRGKRADKTFPIQSPEIGRIVGAKILKNMQGFVCRCS